MIIVKKTIYKALTILILILCILFINTQTTNATVCACYYGQYNGCQTVTTASSSTCETDCKAQFGVINQAQFADGITEDPVVLSQCTQAQSNAVIKENNDGHLPLANPVIPILNVDILGVTFTPPTVKDGDIHLNFFNEYIYGVYAYLLTIGVTISIVLIMVGGLQYSIGSISPTQTNKAKKRIRDAIIGLVLMFLTYLLLSIINPVLLRDFKQVLEIVPPAPEIENDPGDIPPKGSALAGAAICRSIEACRKWCADHPDRSTWPSSNSKTIDPGLTKKIPDTHGVKNRTNSRGTDAMLTGIANAGRIAKNRNSNYTIHVRSGFRPLKTQIRLVCDRFTAGDEERISKIGRAVAFPGGSNHGSGAAIDIQLWEGGKQLITMSYSGQKQSKYKEAAQIFAEIMAEAGFVRYSKEIWHFELEGQASSTCRCKGSACPFPPRC